MKDIKVKDILEICGGELLTGCKDAILEGFKIDTRNVEAGDTYVGIKGEKNNGGDFFEDAFEAGANACIVQDIEIPENSPLNYEVEVAVRK